MDPNRQYNSTFSSKGALVAESQGVLRQLDAGMSLAEIRTAVVEDDLLDRGTRSNRRTVWQHIYRRYISGRSPSHVVSLARFVAGYPDPQAVRLVLFYESCQADALLNDLTIGCAYERYQAARTTIDLVDVSEWLKAQEQDHPEIAAWSLTTRKKLIDIYLSTIRDFGLVVGIKRKEFHKVYVPRAAFVYALFDQHDRGLGGKALISSPDWRLFLLSEEDVIFHLDEAEKGGFVHFRRAGDIYDLRFVYRDLSEAVNVLTS